MGTRFIGYTTPWSRWNEFRQQLDPVYLKECDYKELARMLINWERERKRNIVREWLEIAKEEVL